MFVYMCVLQYVCVFVGGKVHRGHFTPRFCQMAYSDVFQDIPLKTHTFVLTYIHTYSSYMLNIYIYIFIQIHTVSLALVFITKINILLLLLLLLLYVYC